MKPRQPQSTKTTLHERTVDLRQVELRQMHMDGRLVECTFDSESLRHQAPRKPVPPPEPEDAIPEPREASEGDEDPSGEICQLRDCERPLKGKQTAYCSLQHGDLARQRRRRQLALWQKTIRNLCPNDESLVLSVIDRATYRHALAEIANIEQREREYRIHLPTGFSHCQVWAPGEIVDALHDDETRPASWAKRRFSPALPAIEDELGLSIIDGDDANVPQGRCTEPSRIEYAKL